MRILSIDPAYSEKGSKTGYVLCHDMNLVEYGTMTKEQVDDPHQIDFLLGQCDELVVEDQGNIRAANREILKKMIYSRDLWIIPAKWYKTIKKVTLYQPAAWQSKIQRGWRLGKMAKRDPLAWKQYVQRRWDINGDIPGDTVAAMCILSVYLDERKLNK